MILAATRAVKPMIATLQRQNLMLTPKKNSIAMSMRAVSI
jgi:hypothetical protein